MRARCLVVLIAGAATMAGLVSTAQAMPTSLTTRYIAAKSEVVRPVKLRPLVMAQATTTAPNAKEADLATKTASAVDLEKLIGRSVTNAANEKVGDIKSVYVDKSGKVVSLIVGVGGFLGAGDKDVALAWTDVTVSEDGSVSTKLSKDRLKEMPEYKFTDSASRGKVFSDSI
jgi:sporulation protein YlmC with PRC-barrel domain